MAIVATNTVVHPAHHAARPAPAGAPAAKAPAASLSPASSGVAISSLAARLSRAEGAAGAQNAGLSHEALGDKVRSNIERITYPLDAQHKAAAARQVPDPADANATASALAANAYIENLRGPNPFAGLSREQLSTIANDTSGTFTINEQRAAYRQAYDEEQQWRTRAVAQAMQEYHETGKLTNFFSAALEHFNGLPRTEQALYPASYAGDLRDKIELDFNYFTHTPGGKSGPADLNLPDLHEDAAGALRWPESPLP
ncbi:hypothetical protein ACFFTM_16220 [Pseudoduganella plicata]|uniref:Uncharacterized protein n=1 Tax=Pseudoduganella plicata TaxID=321984 RepID=A0A4P7BKP7_9BURK|nr:hypothetical protein [Pseudoduganella plicata]QBQ39050.1 hypothetical protein E1742_25060 [Pseudoduganella plicata]GGY86795.1 hypothetical protein GCM10007388_20110 [Pseudoduganella plicata]